MTNQGYLLPPSMDWVADNPLQTFQEFQALSKFLLEDQDLTE